MVEIHRGILHLRVVFLELYGEKRPLQNFKKESCYKVPWILRPSPHHFHPPPMGGVPQFYRVLQ